MSEEEQEIKEEPKIAEQPKEELINVVDASKATSKATEYLESIYGNLNMTLFRIEEVRTNGDKTKYLVMCSLITSLGSSKRTYYFIKVDIKQDSVSEVNKGFKDSKTGKINWEKINLPPGEE